MAAYEPYDDAGLPVAVADVDQTLTIEAQGGAAFHRAKKRVKVYSSVDGISESRINFSGSNTLWIFVLPFNNLTQANAGTVMQYWVEYGESATYTFKLTYSDSHTYVVRFASDLDEKWLKNLYSHSYIFRVMGKI
jgi:hypothetical protein